MKPAVLNMKIDLDTPARKYGKMQYYTSIYAMAERYAKRSFVYI
jgi:hypothetical protein